MLTQIAVRNLPTPTTKDLFTSLQGIVSTAALVQKACGINIADIKIEEVEKAVTEWSLSGIHFEHTANENSTRRSPSPEVMLIAVPNLIEDLEAGMVQNDF